MHLVDDEHLILAYLWWYACLVHQRFDVLHRVVTGGVKFKDVVRSLLVEGLTALALVAGFTVGSGVQAVDGFGKDARAGGLTDTARAAE